MYRGLNGDGTQEVYNAIFQIMAIQDIATEVDASLSSVAFPVTKECVINDLVLDTL